MKKQLSENPIKKLLPSLPIQQFEELGEKIGTDSEISNSKGVEDIPNSGVDGMPTDMIVKPVSPSFCVYSILQFITPDNSQKSTDGEWKASIQFTTSCRQLACYFPELLIPLLPAIANKLTELCKSIRSVVARSAICATSDLFSGLKDQCFEKKETFSLLQCIIQKIGTEKQFVRNDCISCLEVVC